MANSSLKNNQDEKLNPGDADYRRKVGDDSAYVASGLDQLESFANDPKNSSDDSSLKDKEESPRDGFYNPTATPGSKLAINKGSLSKRKKGPLALIITVLLGGGGIMGLLFGPSVGIIHMKETFMGDLNDQLAALDIRGNEVMKARLKGMTSAGCAVKIKCKFNSMSNRQIRKFERAGFKINAAEGSKVFGRTRVASITGPNGVTYNASNFRSAIRSDHSLRKAFNRAFNPAFVGFASKPFKNMLANKLKTNKSSKLNSTSKENLNKDIKTAAAGERAGLDADRFYVDEDGKEKYRSLEIEDGKEKVYEKGQKGYDDAKAKFDDLNSKLNGLDGKSAFKKVAAGAARGVGVLGAFDSACTVYNMSRAVTSAAKVIRSTQLAQYAMVFLNTADKIKAGTATPEEVAYLGEIISEPDLRERVVANVAEHSGDKYETIENPNYGKSGFDSEGYKLAAYGDIPNPTLDMTRFMLGAGFSGGLLAQVESAKRTVEGAGGGDACKVITHPITRVGGLIAGVALAIGSFGVGTAVSLGAAGAFALALPILEAHLADMLAGTIVDEDTRGVDAVNAAYVGTSVINSSAAQAHGLKPLTKDEIGDYMAVSNEVKSDYIAQQKWEARDNPFDINNQYSFLGSLARIAYPLKSTASNNIVAFIGTIPKLIYSPAISNTNSVKASSFNPDRFNQCQDENYDKLNIAADVFCNVRYGLTKTELALETDTVVDYMLSENYIHPDNGEPVDGEDYDKFLKNCANRTMGYGDSTEEDDNDGTECLKTDRQTSMFRVFTVDNMISDAMDDEEEAEEDTGSNESNVGDVPTGSSMAIAKIIKSNSNITDNTSQINQIVAGRKTSDGNEIINPKVLGVVAAVGENNKFTISSARRYSSLKVGAGNRSWHLTGHAIDLSGRMGINGVKIANYTAHSKVIEDFLVELAGTIDSKNCQIGVPNQNYVKRVKDRSKTNCYVFEDRGTSPHIHIGVK